MNCLPTVTFVLQLVFRKLRDVISGDNIHENVGEYLWGSALLIVSHWMAGAGKT